jgi:hypothetical protein
VTAKFEGRFARRVVALRGAFFSLDPFDFAQDRLQEAKDQGWTRSG